MRAARRTLLVVLAAVLGIALAAAITWGTSQLVRQRIGLASEPLTAGRQLLPTTTGAPNPRSTPRPPSTPTTTTTTRKAPAPAIPSTPASTQASPTTAPSSGISKGEGDSGRRRDD